MNFFANHRTADIVFYYNEAAKELGRPTVTKFQDRETAERRGEEIKEALKAHRAELARLVAPADPAPLPAGAVATTVDVPNPEGDSRAGVVVTGTIAGVRPGSKTQKAIDVLLAAEGKPVTVAQIAEALYGDVPDMTGAAMMRLKCVAGALKPGCGYVLVKTKNENKEITFALSKTV